MILLRVRTDLSSSLSLPRRPLTFYLKLVLDRGDEEVEIIVCAKDRKVIPVDHQLQVADLMGETPRRRTSLCEADEFERLGVSFSASGSRPSSAVHASVEPAAASRPT